MVLFNYSTKELTAKIVYYGPGLCGKTTNLQFVHKNLSDNVRGKMLSLATKTDRTLFFDFLPMDLGEIRGMKTRIQLYTVPGQVFYNETRKLVLKGADGIVFVADSQKEMLGPNIESFKNLEENLRGHGMNLAEMPHVIQFNKRDLPKLSSIEELNAALNRFNAPFYESVATTGIGVQDSLKAITKLVLLHLTKKYEAKTGATGVRAKPQPARVEQPAAPQSVPMAASAATPQTSQPPVDSIPLSSSSPSPGIGLASAESAPEHDAPLPGFGVNEIDDLVDEVRDEAPAQEAAPTEEAAPTQTTEPVVESEPETETEVRIDVEAQPFDARKPVELTDALTDADLFDDPSLEVARLAAGDVREIVIPVQVGRQGADVRRYKLSLRLRLDPVD